MTASTRLAELGLELPQAAAPIGSYQPAVRVGDLVHTSGQLPLAEGQLVATGKLGAGVDLDAGAEAAGVAALNAIAAIALQAGGVDKIIKIIKVVVFVASAADFTAQPKVANGASDLLADVFGDAGVHARSAVGVAVLPMDAPVEVEILAQVSS
jgi:enamine deaminase RidA (YjgF/YER057c/UK114 family)